MLPTFRSGIVTSSSLPNIPEDLHDNFTYFKGFSLPPKRNKFS